MNVSNDIEIPIDLERYSLLKPGITRTHKLCWLIAGAGALLGGVASVAGAVAAPVISGAAAIGSTALGAAGALGSAAVGGVTALGQAIPAAVGGISQVATALKPAADLFGAGYGVYQSMEQVKAQKRAVKIAEKQYATGAQISQEALAMRGTIPPIQTLATQAMPYQPPAEDQAEAKRQFYMPAEPAGLDLMTYAPILLIGVLLWKVIK